MPGRATRTAGSIRRRTSKGDSLADESEDEDEEEEDMLMIGERGRN